MKTTLHVRPGRRGRREALQLSTPVSRDPIHALYPKPQTLHYGPILWRLRQRHLCGHPTLPGRQSTTQGGFLEPQLRGRSFSRAEYPSPKRPTFPTMVGLHKPQKVKGYLLSYSGFGFREAVDCNSLYSQRLPQPLNSGTKEYTLKKP